jgi:hypothetical protein
MVVKFHRLDVDKKVRKEVEPELTSLDKAILEKCQEPINIVRVIKAGKPYIDKFGRKRFANNQQVFDSIKKLVKLKLLETI